MAVETDKRRRPGVLWFVVALQTFLMLGMTILYPAFQNADEGAHVDYVIAHRHGEWFDGPGQRLYQYGVAMATGQVPNTQFATHVAAPPPNRAKRLSFDAIGTTKVLAPVNHTTNQMTQHPPLYYGLAAGFSYLIPDFSHQSFDWQIFWLRAFSTLLLIPVPILIFGAARRLTGNDNLGLLASLVPLAFPAYLRTGGSVTNDSLLVLATVALTAALVRVSLGDLTRRTAVVVGALWTVGLLTKGFALAMPPVIVLAYLVGAEGSFGQRIKRAWQPIVIAGVIGSIAGGWWWVRNEIVYHAVQPNGLGNIDDATRQAVSGPDHAGGTDVSFFGHYFSLLGQRTFGSLGLLDVPSLPHTGLEAMAFLLLLVLIAGIAFGAPRLRGKPELAFLRSWSFGRAVVLILPTILIAMLLYVGARSVYLHGGQLPGIQIRYLFPTVLGPAIIVAVALSRVVGDRLRRWLAPLYLLVSMVFLAISVQDVLDVEMSYASAKTYLARVKGAVHFVVGWAPFGSFGSGLIVGGAAAAALATLVGLVLRAVRSPRGAAAEPFPDAPAGAVTA